MEDFGPLTVIAKAVDFSMKFTVFVLALACICAGLGIVFGVVELVFYIFHIHMVIR